MTTAVGKNQNDYLYQQVVELIKKMKTDGTLLAGEKLPSLRKLSAQLSVSIPTVKQAYLELEKQELIEARPKSGYFLKPSAVSVKPKKLKLVETPITVKRQSLIDDVYQAVHQPNVEPFGISNPTAAYGSDKALGRSMRRVISMAGNNAMKYGPVEGFPELKRQLAYRYLDFGWHVTPDDILITNGAQEAMLLALQCVAKPGDIIAVESPTYFGILELIESLGMLVVEIPVCPDDGLCLDDLKKVISKQPIKACLFSTSINNPLGSCMSDDKRKMLVRMLESKNIPLIEDDVYGDLYFTEKRGIPAQVFSRKGLVLTCSSFSKTAAPSYRIGWIIAPKFGLKARRLKRAFSCSSSLLNQWTLSEFIKSGEYDRNTKKLRQILRCNKDRMIARILKDFPIDVKVSNPKGGSVLWLELPHKKNATDLFHSALTKNISISPGAIFSPTNKFRSCFRLSYGVPWNDNVERAITILGKCIKTI